jgi:hypothetical protein
MMLEVTESMVTAPHHEKAGRSIRSSRLRNRQLFNVAIQRQPNFWTRKNRALHKFARHEKGLLVVLIAKPTNYLQLLSSSLLPVRDLRASDAFSDILSFLGLRHQNPDCGSFAADCL